MPIFLTLKYSISPAPVVSSGGLTWWSQPVKLAAGVMQEHWFSQAPLLHLSLIH
uniref:Uncharacterized protein n=1 Tax=Anguilla anguilla TaxID=7936 RepID=A0A0E9QY79_ANGAN